MQLDLLRDEIWRGLGEDKDLDPDSDVSYDSGPLLTWVVNEGQRQIATWKDPVSGRRTRFRNLVDEIYFKSKVIEGTLKPTGTAATSTTILFSSTYCGSNDDRYNGWVVSTGSGSVGLNRQLIVDYVGSTHSATLHTSFGSIPSNGDTYSLYKDFYYFLPSTDTWLSSGPSSEHILLPSSNANVYRPTGNLYEVLKVEDLLNSRVIPRGHRTESWVSGETDPGDPLEWMRDGKRLVFDRPTNQEMWFRLKYYRYPQKMTSSTDIPEIPEPFHYAIVLWGLWWGFKRKLESTQAYSVKRDLLDYMRKTVGEYEVENDLEDTGGKLRRQDYNTVFGSRS